MFYKWLENINETNASEEDWPKMVNAVHPGAFRVNGRINALHDMTPRVVSADYLDDLGRTEEAKLLRNLNKHVYRHKGKIHDAHSLSFKLNKASPPGMRPT